MHSTCLLVVVVPSIFFSFPCQRLGNHHRMADTVPKLNLRAIGIVPNKANQQKAPRSRTASAPASAGMTQPDRANELLKPHSRVLSPPFATTKQRSIKHFVIHEASSCPGSCPATAQPACDGHHARQDPASHASRTGTQSSDPTSHVEPQYSFEVSAFSRRYVALSICPGADHFTLDCLPQSPNDTSIYSQACFGSHAPEGFGATIAFIDLVLLM
jgi:hypothetical protein